jgi:hypothetical protein
VRDSANCAPMALEFVLRSQKHKSKVRIADMRKRKAWRPDPEIDCLLRAAAEQGKREMVGKIAQAWWDISFGRASRGYDKHLRILNRQRLEDEILVRDAYEAEQRQLRKEALLKKYLECLATITNSTSRSKNSMKRSSRKTPTKPRRGSACRKKSGRNWVSARVEIAWKRP